MQQLCHAGGAQRRAARGERSTQQPHAGVATGELHRRRRLPKAGGMLVECAAAQQQLRQHLGAGVERAGVATAVRWGGSCTYHRPHLSQQNTLCCTTPRRTRNHWAIDLNR